jgi:DNA-binding LacI/PurR family transcriptional regulator
LLLWLPWKTPIVVSGLVALGLPVTVLSSSTDVAGVPFIAIDNRTGIRLALNHLRDLGHTADRVRRLGRERVSMRERHDAFLEVGDRAGSASGREYVLNDPPRWRKLVQCGEAERSADTARRPTRSVRSPTTCGRGAAAARSLNLSVPADLSVVGFDDILLASLTVPKLTTVHLPLLEWTSGGPSLIEVIEEKRESTNHVSITTPRIDRRGSTATARIHKVMNRPASNERRIRQ